MITSASAFPRVGIIGAGIAGLALAIRLRQLGFVPEVLEVRSREQLVTEGAFLTLAPNGMNGLRPLGLVEAVPQAGIATTAIEIMDERGGRLALIDMSDHAAAFGAPSVSIARGLLVGLFLARAEELGVAVHLGERLNAVEASAEEVALTTAAGRRFAFDLLAAADGLRSAVRQAVFPDYPAPAYTGLTGTGGLQDGAAVAPTGGVMRMVFGREAFFGYQRQGDGPVFWFDSHPLAEPPRAIADPAGFAEGLRRLHAADPPFVRTILEPMAGVDAAYPIFGLPPLPCWHRGRVVLVGDAAHAVGPHAGQGASMAIEDALVLAAELAASPGPAAFARYEARRRPRIAEVVRITARNGSQKRAGSAFARLVRRLLLPWLIPIGVRAARRFCAYRVDRDTARPADAEPALRFAPAAP